MGSPKLGNSRSRNKCQDPYSGIKASNLFHFNIPKSFLVKFFSLNFVYCDKGETFEKIFEYLTNHQNILPIGLYRKVGCKDNFHPYVVTNPDPETILTKFDILFILSDRSPPENSNQIILPF